MILYNARFEAQDCNDNVWEIIQELLSTHPNVEFFHVNYMDGDYMEYSFALTLRKEKKNEEIYTSEKNP